MLQKQSLTSSSNLQGPVDLVVTAARPDDLLPVDQVQRVLVVLLVLKVGAEEIPRNWIAAQNLSYQEHGILILALIGHCEGHSYWFS